MGIIQNQSNHIHYIVFEMLDKEMRKIPIDKIKCVVVEDDLTKDVYPVNLGVNRLLKKFALPNHFYFNHRNQTEVHFIKSRDKSGKLILSVIALKLLLFKDEETTPVISEIHPDDYWNKKPDMVSYSEADEINFNRKPIEHIPEDHIFNT